MKYARLYCTNGNIGDDIQALAAGRHLPVDADLAVDRDEIHRWSCEEPVTVIMNGWFSRNTEAWPPSPAIQPIFAGFHVSARMRPAIARHAAYLKRFGTIGARDPSTTEFLRSLGVEAETTYCLTLTFPTRAEAPKDGKVFLVDANDIAIPAPLRRGAVKVTHDMPPLDYRVTFPMARQLLDLYRDTARLVITTRLHAALPCIAMGIPVVYFADPRDGRANIVRDIGGVVHDRRLHSKRMGRGLAGRLLSRVDWSPVSIDVSPVKARLTRFVSERLASAIV